MTYNGHKNWNHWNVSLWINNDEGLYRLAQQFKREHRSRREAAKAFMDTISAMWDKTPDGAPWSVSSVYHAMVEL
jgi:hypothetical protein